MTLWLFLLLMTAAAIMAVLWPLSRRPASVTGGNDVAVYRDQLDEIERDRALGTIAGPEAEAARVEVSRRLLAAADASAAQSVAAAVAPIWRRRAVAVVALVALPLGAGSLYLALGSPDLPDQPLAERMAKVQAGTPAIGGGQAQAPSIEALVARVEAYLDKNPEDGRGWEVVAPVYMRIGNYAAAVRARGNALRLLGPTADREADHGEAMVAAADGMVTAPAKAAFERALKLDRDNVSGRFYLGLAAEQEGRKSEAIAAWRALIADAPPEANWSDFVRRAIARAEGKDLTAERPADHPPARTTADVGKALGMPAPAQAPAPSAAPDAGALAQNEMVRGMVARLAARLKQDGSDVDGWLRLVRSYLVLGEAAKAREAAADARQALGADAEKLRRLNAGIKDLGLEG